MRGARIDQAWSLATGRPELALCGGPQRALTPAIKEPADLAGKFGLVLGATGYLQEGAQGSEANWREFRLPQRQ